MLRYGAHILSIEGVSPLVFNDEPTINLAISHTEVRHKTSWLYCLRASRDDTGKLGYKSIKDGIVVIIGIRNKHVYLMPVVDGNNIYAIHGLCRQLYEITHLPIIVRRAELSVADNMPLLDCRDTHVPLEDDEQPEAILDFRKIFTPDGELIRQAVRWRRKLAAFAPKIHEYSVSTSLHAVAKHQIDAFFSSPLVTHKRSSYEKIVQFMSKTKNNRYGCMIFVKGDDIRGLYVYELLGLGKAGLYCGLTTRDEPGLTEWMDYHAFRDLYIRGVHQLFLGGAEKVGVDKYIDKLLAQKPPYESCNYLYDYANDNDIDFVIRPATPADLKSIARFYADFYNSLDKLGERWTLETARKFISHFYARQPDLFFVAEKNTNIISVVMAAIQPWWDGNHLVEGELLIDRSFRQHTRCTTELLQALLRVAESDYQAVAWDTIVPSTPGHPFEQYKQLGFRDVPLWHAVSGDVRNILTRLRGAN
jgi:hypothetical protein